MAAKNAQGVPLYWALVEAGRTPGGALERAPEGVELPQGFTAAYDSLGAFLESEAVADTLLRGPGDRLEVVEFTGVPMEGDPWRGSGVTVARLYEVTLRAAPAAFLDEVARADPEQRAAATNLRSVVRLEAVTRKRIEAEAPPPFLARAAAILDVATAQRVADDFLCAYVERYEEAEPERADGEFPLRVGAVWVAEARVIEVLFRTRDYSVDALTREALAERALEAMLEWDPRLGEYEFRCVVPD